MNYIIGYYSIISGFPVLLVIIEFFYFIRRDKRLLRWGTLLLDIMIFVVPLALLMDLETCYSSMTDRFIIPHAKRIPVYGLIMLCLSAYFYSSSRKKIAHPVMEVVINCLLLIGVAENMLIAIRLGNAAGILSICMPAAMLLILMLVNNHRLLIFTLENLDSHVPEPAPRGRLFFTCLYLLRMRPVAKLLMLLTLCIPVLVVLTKVMLLSDGQPINH